ncbi:hypothetical protein X474_22010 [Dethiosulfatarculus sandiegensis]|uniref:Uncharacterized protein n=1 Tax=Dethiosulfatarculus sandiegensis TaxID=1429043 RepID=A0A0D2JQZ8_9BACT|nr:hypothetical protein X474_22010 [Dethiosulfatarculus sandiegensis]
MFCSKMPAASPHTAKTARVLNLKTTGRGYRGLDYFVELLRGHCTRWVGLVGLVNPEVKWSIKSFLKRQCTGQAFVGQGKPGQSFGCNYSKTLYLAQVLKTGESRLKVRIEVPS